MKVTVRNVNRPDDDIQDWPYGAHLGLPVGGDTITLPRSDYQARERVLHVLRREWNLAAGRVVIVVNDGN